MRVRIKSHGPLAWQISVQDTDTGDMLPVLWDEYHGIELHQRDGLLYARVDIFVDEIDIEVPAEQAKPCIARQYNLTFNTSAPREQISQALAAVDALTTEPG